MDLGEWGGAGKDLLINVRVYSADECCVCVGGWVHVIYISNLSSRIIVIRKSCKANWL